MVDFSMLYGFSVSDILSVGAGNSELFFIGMIPYFLCSIGALYNFVKINWYSLEHYKRLDLYNSMLQDKKRLNCSVVLLMCKILRSDVAQLYANKLTFVVNYVRLAFANEADYIIDSLVKKNIESGHEVFNTKINAYIHYVKHTILTPYDWFRDLKRKEDVSILPGNSYSHYHNLSDDVVMEVAYNLADYLSVEQKKYLSYLLFQMSYLDNNANSMELYSLKKICVDNFLTKEEYTKLADSFVSCSQERWFRENLEMKNPNEYSDPNVVVNIFPANDNGTNNKYAVRDVFSPIVALVFFLFFIIFFSLFLNFTRYHCLDTLCMGILFFVYIYLISRIVSFKYNTVISVNDIKKILIALFWGEIQFLLSVFFLIPSE